MNKLIIFLIILLILVSCRERYAPTHNNFLPNKEKQVTENNKGVSIPEHSNPVMYFSVPFIIWAFKKRMV
jgi:hypothetical protein